MGEAVAAFHHLDQAAPHHVRRREPVDGLAVEFDAALGHVAAFGAQQVGDRLQRRGLAGAVGAEEGNDAPFGNRQRHAPQHQDDVIVDHLDVVDRQQRRRHRGDPGSDQLSLAQSRGVMFLSLAYFAADCSTIGRSSF